eukprot:14240621-Alexandrium_andersonii.AAC.1
MLLGKEVQQAVLVLVEVRLVHNPTAELLEDAEALQVGPASVPTVVPGRFATVRCRDLEECQLG